MTRSGNLICTPTRPVNSSLPRVPSDCLSSRRTYIHAGTAGKPPVNFDPERAGVPPWRAAEYCRGVPGTTHMSTLHVRNRWRRLHVNVSENTEPLFLELCGKLGHHRIEWAVEGFRDVVGHYFLPPLLHRCPSGLIDEAQP